MQCVIFARASALAVCITILSSSVSSAGTERVCEGLLLTKPVLVDRQELTEAEKERLPFVKVAAAHDITAIWPRLDEFGITTDQAMLEVIGTSPTRWFSVFSRSGGAYRLRTETARYELALLGMRNRDVVSSHIRDFGIHNEELLFKVASAAISSGEPVAVHIRDFNIRNQALLFALAKAAATTSRVIHLANFDLQNERQRFEITSIALRVDADGILDLDAMDLKPGSKQALLKQAVRAFGHEERFLSHLAEKLPTNPAKKNELVRIAFAHHRRELLTFTGKLSEFRLSVDEESHYLNELINDVVAFRDKLNRPLDVLHIFAHRPKHEFQTVEAARTFFESFAQKYSTVLPSSWVSAAWDNIQSRDAGLHLLAFAYGLRGASRADFGNSTEILFPAVGIPTGPALRLPSSKRRVAHLYSTLIDIQHLLDRPAFERLPIDADVLAREEFTDFLDSLRNLFQLRGANQLTWDQIVNDLRISKVSALNIEALSADLTGRVLSEFKRQFELDGTVVRPQDLTRLENEWLDLEPLHTLLATLRGKTMKGQVSLLSRVFEFVLRGEFHKYKFEGDSSDEADVMLARAQTEALRTKEALQAWAKARTALALFNEPTMVVHGQLPNDALLQRAREFISSRITPRLAKAAGRGLGLRKDQEAVSKVLLQIGKRDPRLILQDLATRAEPALVSKAIIARLNTETNLAVLKETTRLLTLLVQQHPDLARQGQSETLVKDLTALFGSFKAWGFRQNDPGAGAVIIASALSADPRLLIAIGEVVDAHSCQSYKNGEIVQTLLSYVIDANVQTLVSFVLKQDSFEDFNSFQAVRHAVQHGQPVATSFDGNRMIFSFRIKERSISSRPISRAYLRQLVKLGRTEDGGPGIITERAFEKEHAGLVTMKQLHRSILADLARETESALDQPITVSPSRNPEGVYSDIAQGIQRGEHVLKPDSGF